MNREDWKKERETMTYFISYQEWATSKCATILNMPFDDRKAVKDWLIEAAKDALYDEPDVGIFGNPNMSDMFNILADIVDGYQ